MSISFAIKFNIDVVKNEFNLVIDGSVKKENINKII